MTSTRTRSTMRAWSGRAVTEARQHMAGLLPAPCARCGQTITPSDRWVIGHKLSRATHPHLTWEVTNWQHEHRRCSDKSGQAGVQAKAAADALNRAGFPVPKPGRQSRYGERTNIVEGGDLWKVQTAARLALSPSLVASRWTGPVNGAVGHWTSCGRTSSGLVAPDRCDD